MCFDGVRNELSMYRFPADAGVRDCLWVLAGSVLDCNRLLGVACTFLDMDDTFPCGVPSSDSTSKSPSGMPSF